MTSKRTIARAVLLVALGLVGCQRGHDAHPVAGAVTWPGGPLAGHHVEVTATDDPTARGFGTIGPDGRFRLERLIAGAVQPGLPPGTYKARLVLVDEGDGQTLKPKVPKRYLDFKQSGWTVTVPSAGDTTLNVAAK